MIQLLIYLQQYNTKQHDKPEQHEKEQTENMKILLQFKKMSKFQFVKFISRKILFALRYRMIC